MDNESGIKFCGFYLYKKKIDGIVRKLTRMVCFENSLEEAEAAVKGRVFNTDSDKIDNLKKNVLALELGGEYVIPSIIISTDGFELYHII